MHKVILFLMGAIIFYESHLIRCQTHHVRIRNAFWVNRRKSVSGKLDLGLHEMIFDYGGI